MKKTLVSFMLPLSLVLLPVMKKPPSVMAASAAPQLPTPQEGKGCSVPREWGRLAGVSDRAIAFEDSDGTIRVLDVGPCMRGEAQLIAKIKRQ
jgi:hypothetical protein